MIKNQETAQQILDILSTLRTAAETALVFMRAEACNNTIVLLQDMETLLLAVKPVAQSLYEEDENIKLPLACESLLYSLENIRNAMSVDIKKAAWKNEFELIPLFRSAHVEFLFWATVYPDLDKMGLYYGEQAVSLSANQYIDKAIETGCYKYDLSIVVVAYNKLEYTKMCIEHLFKHLPSNIKYELILVNHGSSDGTKEYFASLKPDKQLDIKINGSVGAVPYIVEGKYYLNISNDVLVTQGAIENLYRCIDSDGKNAWVVPTTSNVSNLQAIPVTYSNLHELYTFAEQNNISNQYKWEQRVRLCNPIDIRRSSVHFSSQGIGYAAYIHAPSFLSFPDDKLSLLLRRDGYKLILAKDTYCHHFGQITTACEIRDESNTFKQQGRDDYYTRGRKQFRDVFGIDPWGTGFCYDPQLMDCLPFEKGGHVDILGVNCGIGSNPLKIKENLKEIQHNLDVVVYNITDNVNYKEDLQGVSDQVKIIKGKNQIVKAFEGISFQYIVWEDDFSFKTEFKVIFRILMNRLAPEGILSWHVLDKYKRKAVHKLYPQMREVGDWVVINKVHQTGESEKEYNEM